MRLLPTRTQMEQEDDAQHQEDGERPDGAAAADDVDDSAAGAPAAGGSSAGCALRNWGSARKQAGCSKRSPMEGAYYCAATLRRGGASQGSARTSGAGATASALGALNIWGLATAVTSSVKAQVGEIVNSVAQTDWRAEVAAFSKEAAVEGKNISHKTAEVVQHLPDVVEQLHIPEQVRDSMVTRGGSMLRGVSILRAHACGARPHSVEQPCFHAGGARGGPADAQRAARHPQRGRLAQDVWRLAAHRHQGAHRPGQPRPCGLTWPHWGWR